MTPDIAAFLAELKAHPKFADYLAEHPEFADQLEVMERGVADLYVAGTVSTAAIGFWDEVRAIVHRKELYSSRLQAISEVFRRWEALRKP
jgi:hypothetical protein